MFYTLYVVRTLYGVIRLTSVSVHLRTTVVIHQTVGLCHTLKIHDTDTNFESTVTTNTISCV